MKYDSPARNPAYRKRAKEIGQRIRGEAERKRTLITPLAYKAGVSQGNLCRMVSHGTCCLQLFALYKIAAALKVSIKRILPPGYPK